MTPLITSFPALYAISSSCKFGRLEILFASPLAQFLLNLYIPLLKPTPTDFNYLGILNAFQNWKYPS